MFSQWNPDPAVVWSKLNSQSEISQSAVSAGRLRLRNVKGSDSGVYQCSAENILGKALAVAQLEVNGKCFDFRLLTNEQIPIIPYKEHMIDGRD